MAKVCKEAEKRGWEVGVSGSNHLKLTHPKYGFITASMTPTNGAVSAERLQSDLAHREEEWNAAEQKRHMKQVIDLVDKSNDHVKQTKGFQQGFHCEHDGCSKTYLSMVALCQHIEDKHESPQPEPEPVVIETPTPDKEPDTMSIEEQVRDAIHDLEGTEVSPTELADLVHLDSKQVNNALLRMTEKGEVTKVGRGAYLYTSANGHDVHEHDEVDHTGEPKMKAKATSKLPKVEAVKTPETMHVPNSLVLAMVGIDGRAVMKGDDGVTYLVTMEKL